MKAVVAALAAFKKRKPLSVITIFMWTFLTSSIVDTLPARAGWVSFSWMATLSGIWSKLVLATSRHPNLRIEVSLG